MEATGENASTHYDDKFPVAFYEKAQINFAVALSGATGHCADTPNSRADVTPLCHFPAVVTNNNT